MKRPIYLFYLLCLPCFLTAQIRYQEPVFDQVNRTTSIKYAKNVAVVYAFAFPSKFDQPLLLNFYEPIGDTLANRPLVLVIPGGFLLSTSQNATCDGSPGDSVVVEICTRLAKMGYVAAAIDYRRGWYPLAPTQQERMKTYAHAMYRGIQDARSAIRFFKKSVVENGNPYRIDSTRIVLWGEASGGQLALGAAYANAAADWIDTSLVIAAPDVQAINPAYLGNVWGTDAGVLDSTGAVLYKLYLGDTLCYPNSPGYSSDFQLCVSMAGSMPDLPWIGPGEMPAILFHVPEDPLQPCNNYNLVVPNIDSLPIMPVAGSCALAGKLDLTGNNQVFLDADINDCVSFNANNNTGGLEGFYPFNGLPINRDRPWAWTSPCNYNPEGPTDGAFARKYLDTIFAYFAPRACAALGLCNAQPDASGLCGTQIRGKVFLDENQNGLVDTSEQFMPGVVLEVQPIGHHVASGPTGKYSIGVSPGNYTLLIPDLPKYYAATDTSIAVTVNAGADVVQNFGLYPSQMVNDLQLFMTPLNEARPGFSKALSVKWTNVGTTKLSGSILVKVDSGYTITGSNIPINIAGQIASWSFTDLDSRQSGQATLQLLLSANVPLGEQLSSTGIINGTGITDQTPADNKVVVTELVIGSFDPNDKRVVPAGDVTAEALDTMDNWLDYTIRFQNTGTASAYNIHIVDTLSELLNINTLELLDASHPMHWEIGGRGTLTWFFDNIHLPDSLHDEPRSHGFVRYRIKPVLPISSLLHQSVHNFADIYFDFNAPVRTNTTETNFTEKSAIITPRDQEKLRIMPNPAGDMIYLEAPAETGGENLGLRIWNASGKLVLFRELPDPLPLAISVKDLPEGLYMVQLKHKNRVTAGRFIKI